MEWVETTANTVDDARARALDLLGVDSADAEIEVIDEGKKGLFGRVKTEARVRARIRPKAPPAREERRPRRGGGGKGRGGQGGGRDGNRGGNNRGGRGGGGKGRGGQGGGNRDGGNRDGGSRDGGNRDGGNRGGSRDGGNRDGGNRGGSRDGGNRGGSRDGGNRDGNRDGGRSKQDNRNARNDDARTSEKAQSGGSRGGGSRDGGSRDGGSRDGGRNQGRNDNDAQRETRNDAAETKSQSSNQGGRARRSAETAGVVASNLTDDDAPKTSRDRDRGRNRGGDRDGGGRDGGSRDSGNRDSRRGGRDQSRSERSNNKRDTTQAASAVAAEGTQEKAVDEEFPIEEQGDTVTDFVAGLAEIFDDGSSVTIADDGETLEAQVAGGEDVGLMIGPGGATLSAIEELTRTTMQRAAAGRRYRRLRVDVDEYRLRRREALAGFVTKLAEDVVADGRSKALEPMNSSDRKTVHDTVADIDGVSTLSEGNDPRRYVVLVPDED